MDAMIDNRRRRPGASCVARPAATREWRGTASGRMRPATRRRSYRADRGATRKTDVVDEDVEPPNAATAPSMTASTPSAVVDVSCHADRAVVAAGAVGHVRAPARGSPPCGAQADEASFDGQRPGARQTEPAARARHDRHLVSKSEVHSVGIITERQYAMMRLCILQRAACGDAIMKWQGTGKRQHRGSARHGMGGGMRLPVGGGIGGIVLLLLVSALTGTNPLDLISTFTGDPSDRGRARRAPIAIRRPRSFPSSSADTEDTWGEVFRERGEAYVPPMLVLFDDATTVGVRCRTRRSGSVLLSRGSEGLPRSVVLPRARRALRRAGRFRPGLRRRARSRPSRADPAGHVGIASTRRA